MKYLHSASNKQIQELLDKKTTIGELKQQYSQPNWCNYPDALNGTMGCWSLMDLMDLRKKISRKFCKTCDCSKDFKDDSPPLSSRDL